MKSLAEVPVPKSMKDISWNTFYEFYKLQDTTFFKTAKVVSLLLNIPYEDVINEEAYVVLNKFRELSYLYDDMENLTLDMTNEIVIDGEIYMIHDLTIFKEFATYASIEQRFKDTYDAIPYQLSLLLRKAGETTDNITDDIQKERAELFMHLPAEDIIKLHNFFLFRSETMFQLIEAYSQPILPQTEQQKEELLENLLQIILGSEQPQNWLMKTLRSWVKYLMVKRLMYFGF